MASSSSTFDALAAARELEAAGIERRQAEAIAEGMRRAAVADRDALATKSDIVGAKADIAGVKADIATLRWMFGFLAALNLAMAAKLFGLFGP